MVEKVIIMGAAGRDFHNFNVYFRDNERYESYQESMKIYEDLKSTYVRLGYEIEIIPLASVENRVEFILQALGI